MFKDYYQILGVTQGATSQQIRSAYRFLSKKWHPDKNPNINVTCIMQDINEAYAILKDDNKRRRYDIEYDRYLKELKSSSVSVRDYNYNQEEKYDFDIKDEILKQEIYEAREYSKKIVDEFIKSLQIDTKKALKGASKEMIGYFWGFLVIFVIGLIIRLSISYNNQIDNEHYSELVDTLSTYDIPDTWKQHTFDSAFSLAFPDILELRMDDDVYTCQLDSHFIFINNGIIVFQQKDLSLRANDKHYLRVIIYYSRGENGDFLCYNQIENIDPLSIDEIVYNEIQPYVLLESPQYKWNDLNGIKILEIRYKRSGNNDFTTQGIIYVLQNNNEIVKITIAYREQEDESCVSDMEHIIRTFRWEDY